MNSKWIALNSEWTVLLLRGRGARLSLIASPTPLRCRCRTCPRTPRSSSQHPAVSPRATSAPRLRIEPLLASIESGRRSPCGLRLPQRRNQVRGAYLTDTAAACAAQTVHQRIRVPAKQAGPAAAPPAQKLRRHKSSAGTKAPPVRIHRGRGFRPRHLAGARAFRLAPWRQRPAPPWR